MFVLCLKRAKVMQHVILNKARAYKKSTLLIHSKIFYVNTILFTNKKIKQIKGYTQNCGK